VKQYTTNKNVKVVIFRDIVDVYDIVNESREYYPSSFTINTLRSKNFAILEVKIPSARREPKEIIDRIIAFKPNIIRRQDIISCDIINFSNEISSMKYHILEIVTKNAKALVSILDKLDIEIHSWSVLLTSYDVQKMISYWFRKFNEFAHPERMSWDESKMLCLDEILKYCAIIRPESNLLLPSDFDWIPQPLNYTSSPRTLKLFDSNLHVESDK